MELKATLDKPYTEEERIQFIIDNNDGHGYQIKETEIALEAWGYTAEEIAEQEKERRKLDVQNKIKELNEYALNYIRIKDQQEIDIINNIILGLENSLSN